MCYYDVFMMFSLYDIRVFLWTVFSFTSDETSYIFGIHSFSMPFNTTHPSTDFLAADEYVDYDSPVIAKKAGDLFSGLSSDVARTEAAFNFVRDEILHIFDTGEDIITVKASDVLTKGRGICHTKSILLAAFLRYVKIPSGFCFERITLADDDSEGYCVHCFNAAFVNGRWVFLDTGVNKYGINAEFSPDRPVFAFIPRPQYDEYFWNGIHARPQHATMLMLENAKTREDIFNNIPDYLDEKPDIEHTF